MTTQTFEITDEELKIINTIKSIIGIKSIKDAVKFIIKDYARTKSYSNFINKKIKELKDERSRG